MRSVSDDNDFGDAPQRLRRVAGIDCERSTLLAGPRRFEGHHVDGCCSPLNPSADSAAMPVRQASEPQSGIHTVHSTYRKDRSAKVASLESNVQPYVLKSSLLC